MIGSVAWVFRWFWWLVGGVFAFLFFGPLIVGLVSR